MLGCLRGMVLPVLVLALLVGCVDLTPPPALLEVIPSPPADARPADHGGLDRGTEVPPVGPPPDAIMDVDSAPKDAGPDVSAPDRTSDAPLSPNGAACATGSQCLSGHCVDGSCCNSACGGACQACDVTDAVGACSPIPSGQDPDEECAEEAVSTCGLDGFCDGNGACRRHVVGTQCEPGRCADSTEYAASTCNAAGVCQAGSSRSCAPNVCMGDGCGSACVQQADCLGGFFCDGTICRARLANGTPCGMPFQCASEICADGVCCATACGQACHACNLTGAVGACTPIADGQDPDSECPMQTASSCGRRGGCNGRGACRLHPTGTACGGASCNGATETAAASCDGAGGCQPGATRTCPGTLCSGTTCAAGCTSAAQCQTNHKCVRSACEPWKIAGLTVHDTVRASSWAIERNFQVGTTGAHPWADYPASYVVSLDAPASFFLGNEWIRVHAQSKMYTGGPQATISLAGAADVYLLIDDRWGLSPTWLSGWTNTNYNITVFENATRPMLPFSVFQKTNQTGSVTVPPIGANTAFNYFVIVD